MRPYRAVARVGLAAINAHIVSTTNFEGWITRSVKIGASGEIVGDARFSLRGALPVSAAALEGTLDSVS